MNERLCRDHFRVETRVARELSMEIPAMAIGPVHHWAPRKAQCSDLSTLLARPSNRDAVACSRCRSPIIAIFGTVRHTNSTHGSANYFLDAIRFSALHSCGGGSYRTN